MKTQWSRSGNIKLLLNEYNLKSLSKNQRGLSTTMTAHLDLFLTSFLTSFLTTLSVIAQGLSR